VTGKPQPKNTKMNAHEIRLVLEDGGNDTYQFLRDENGWLAVSINGELSTGYHNGENSDFWSLVEEDFFRNS
jgi:hypothetical protein